ncbi:2-hydroxyacid dehydrogenase [Aureliella helgolandensis]|uniref:Glyoxylate/hydroxypyruvate reductase B n=1 Tax=Aureliella helgolandensis TaxID=2527968 RepID=A0A518GC64_9BACT|nr:D-glycerate dehydrogenase [Aureliella helgolandensis]QDV26185.1 Putative 2-hydroxyacid dehydrogenase [Aureliella helgolandensis]
MTKPIVYIARQLPAIATQLLEGHAELRQHAGELPPTRQELLEGVKGCAGILSLLSDRIDAEVLDAAGPNLKVISNFAVGYNNIEIAEARNRQIAVGNTPDVLTDATADIAIALLLSVARRLKEGERAVRSGEWTTWEPLGWMGLELQGKTLGIVGMGRIGEAVARRMVGGWGMQLRYTARTTKPLVDAQLGGRHVPLAELLADSDFVSLHVPLSTETRHLIGAAEFELMKPTAVLVNTARGEIVDQEALEGALRTRRIFGAGLDVCTPEPLPTSDPLLKLDNCLVVPHIGSATLAARDAMAERAARNLLAGLAGSPLPFAV